MTCRFQVLEDGRVTLVIDIDGSIEQKSLGVAFAQAYLRQHPMSVTKLSPTRLQLVPDGDLP